VAQELPEGQRHLVLLLVLLVVVEERQRLDQVAAQLVRLEPEQLR
jgi:hypothetical protein